MVHLAGWGLPHLQPAARAQGAARRAHPRVALHFNTDATGDQDVIIFVGTAVIDKTALPAHKVRAYLRKYREGIQELGMTPGQFSDEYSVAIRVTPTTLRGW
jgi:PPOX class probable F420-dependent enzyme